jgi:hypothetical protein
MAQLQVTFYADVNQDDWYADGTVDMQSVMDYLTTNLQPTDLQFDITEVYSAGIVFDQPLPPPPVGGSGSGPGGS